ncbi:MAG: cob(I)yrinic acid a,c-diamide adenosyltransferase [Verrucomicrobiae bacterium]|nr:cob(I)yrinic acid a,c-diamide adenosyltransferase [Verrucomicrobiae bacterium]
MSIVTKTGDQGTTALMYGRRVPKHHPRIEACGSVDELNAALGLARAVAANTPPGEALLGVQRDLIALMGELAVLPEDLPRYVQDGFARVTPEMTARLDAQIAELEGRGVGPKGWALPGANPLAAALDNARAVCRRAERRVCALREAEPSLNPQVLIYLNRLADWLWLQARAAEAAQD